MQTHGAAADQATIGGDHQGLVRCADRCRGRVYRDAVVDVRLCTVIDCIERDVAGGIDSERVIALIRIRVGVCRIAGAVLLGLRGGPVLVPLIRVAAAGGGL